MGYPSRFFKRGVAKARPRHAPGTMNNTERRYAAEVLEPKRLAGEVLSYAFEKVKIRLADNTFYTPDFFVVLPSMEIEFHEVKGRKGNGYYATDDAKVKLKVAAEIFPARFVVAWPQKAGGWRLEQI